MSSAPTHVAAAVVLALSALSCGPPVTDARRLWLNTPRDGFVVLQDVQPAPF